MFTKHPCLPTSTAESTWLKLCTISLQVAGNTRTHLPTAFLFPKFHVGDAAASAFRALAVEEEEVAAAVGEAGAAEAPLEPLEEEAALDDPLRSAEEEGGRAVLVLAGAALADAAAKEGFEAARPLPF